MNIDILNKIFFHLQICKVPYRFGLQICKGAYKFGSLICKDPYKFSLQICKGPYKYLAKFVRFLSGQLPIKSIFSICEIFCEKNKWNTLETFGKPLSSSSFGLGVQLNFQHNMLPSSVRDGNSNPNLTSETPRWHQ